ncbi:hypothetical protein, partial [Mesorhizobium sp.]|uniref:hypothetical protein n=1 Tax=Mesorhizobium sp. TaxID=1871066 RepID=UPI0025EEBFBD
RSSADARHGSPYSAENRDAPADALLADHFTLPAQYKTEQSAKVESTFGWLNLKSIDSRNRASVDREGV